jgi:hypothetical protein
MDAANGVYHGLDRQNFEAWFPAIIEPLYDIRAAGFAIAMITFPLFERYIRQKVGLRGDETVNEHFLAELIRLIPGLTDVSHARYFWTACRHGLLHQATVQIQTSKGQPLPRFALTHDIAQVFEENQGVFLVHPVLFAKRTIELIRADFATYAGHADVGPPLPRVEAITFYGAAPSQRTATVSTTPCITTGAPK